MVVPHCIFPYLDIVHYPLLRFVAICMPCAFIIAMLPAATSMVWGNALVAHFVTLRLRQKPRLSRASQRCPRYGPCSFLLPPHLYLRILLDSLSPCILTGSRVLPSCRPTRMNTCRTRLRRRRRRLAKQRIQSTRRVALSFHALVIYAVIDLVYVRAQVTNALRPYRTTTYTAKSLYGRSPVRSGRSGLGDRCQRRGLPQIR